MSLSLPSHNAELIPVESPSRRSYFYVGGHYQDDGKGENQHIMTGQMYVERLIPIDGVKHKWPLVSVHGAGQTGIVSPISPSPLLVHVLRVNT